MSITCFYSHKMKRIVAILFLVSGLAVQLTAQKTIAFEATNESLGSVLLRLAATNTVNLTYNPADPALETKVNYSATAKNPTEILNDILSFSGSKPETFTSASVFTKTSLLTKLNEVN